VDGVNGDWVERNELSFPESDGDNGDDGAGALTSLPTPTALNIVITRSTIVVV
jgi:hypothetical protein